MQKIHYWNGFVTRVKVIYGCYDAAVNYTAGFPPSYIWRIETIE